jgi:hypothetical protein
MLLHGLHLPVSRFAQRYVVAARPPLLPPRVDPTFGATVTAISLTSTGHNDKSCPLIRSSLFLLRDTTMIHDLIDLDGDSASLKSTTNGLVGKMTLANKGVEPTHRDSFSDLASMMRAKKLHTPISTPAPPPQPLTVAPNGRCFNGVSF